MPWHPSAAPPKATDTGGWQRAGWQNSAQEDGCLQRLCASTVALAGCLLFSYLCGSHEAEGSEGPPTQVWICHFVFCATRLTRWLFIRVLSSSDLCRVNSHLRKCLISTGSLSCRGQRSQANKLSLPSCFLPTASVLKKALFLEFLLAFICTLSN